MPIKLIIFSDKTMTSNWTSPEEKTTAIKKHENDHRDEHSNSSTDSSHRLKRISTNESKELRNFNFAPTSDHVESSTSGQKSLFSFLDRVRIFPFQSRRQ